MKILLIHQAFVSPDEPGGTRHYELARLCVKSGHEFTIIASDLSYLSGKRVASAENPSNEKPTDQVEIIRAYTYPALHKNFIWRVFSFISFMITSVWKSIRISGVDVVLGTTPPIFQSLSAWVISVLRRRPFLLEVRDLWPAFAIDMGVLKNPVLIRMSFWLELFLYKRATHIIVNSPAYRSYISTKGIPLEKISLVPNGVDPAAFSIQEAPEEIKKDLGFPGKFVVTYAGALGLANNIQIILQAAKSLLAYHQIHFLLVGDGKERQNLERTAAEFMLTNVTFMGPIPKRHMPRILAASDACIAILKDIPMFRTTYPNKVFDYMAAAKPTLLAIDGVIRDVIEQSQGGIFVPPGNSLALSEKILYLFGNQQEAKIMGVRARDYVIKNFDRANQAVSFIQLMAKYAFTSRPM